MTFFSHCSSVLVTLIPLLAALQLANAATYRTDTFRVVTAIDGRNASTHYTAQVRKAGTTGWTDAMVLMTTSKEPYSDERGSSCGYFPHLTNWTQNWLSLEVNEVDEIEVKIQRLSKPIKTASLVPDTTGAVVKSISDSGAVIVSLTKMAQFYIADDGGMNDVDTGPNFKGEMHTMTIFANPMLDAPNKSDNNVMVIHPSDWDNGNNALAAAPLPGTTVIFEAGVHRPQIAFWSWDGKGQYHPGTVPLGYWPLIPTYENTTYFIQPDAIIMAGMKTNASTTITTFEIGGYGALSGEEMNRLNIGVHPPDCGNNISPGAISVHTSGELRVSGITSIDFPDHHIMLVVNKCNPNAKHPCVASGLLENTKVMGWRANGDGIHVFLGTWRLANNWMRTQDDSCYLSGPDSLTVENLTTWNDANGVSYVLGSNTHIKNSNPIYARSQNFYWLGGRVFSHRAELVSPGVVKKTSFKGNVSDLILENIVIQDPFPTLNAFQLEEIYDIKKGEPEYSFGHNVSFTNIHVAATSTARTCKGTSGCNCYPACENGGSLPYGIPNKLSGYGNASVSGINFTHVTIAGMNIKHMLDGSAPGYFNITHDTVSDIYVDGSRVL